jgi:hypothetical protein
MHDLILDGSKDPMKQKRYTKRDSNNPKNGIKLSPKRTLRGKRNRTKEKHRKGEHLKKKNNVTNMGMRLTRR